MNEEKAFKIIDKFNNENEYEILITFKWMKTKKNYIVYTDNTKDEEGNLNVFAAIYYPQDDSKLDAIETDEEWEQIERRLKDLEN